MNHNTPACWLRLQVRTEELTYNGKSFGEFQVARSAAYVSQVSLLRGLGWEGRCGLVCCGARQGWAEGV